MTPIQRFNRRLAAAQLLTPRQTVVVAVSTGVDSMVLLTLLQRLPRTQRPRIIVAHVNHHLRAQSQQEVEFLTAYCKAHHLTLRVADWPVATHPASGIEAAGRTFRYQFFERLLARESAAALLTAHHANDQVETYLMKLARGGDLAQLTGIAAERPLGTGKLVRPLLDWPKAELRAFAEQQHVTFFEDVTNQDIQLTRNRIRHQVVPELLAVNPALLSHVASYEQQLAELLRAKQQMVAYLLPPILSSRGELRISEFNRIPSAWQLPVLQAWVNQRSGGLVSELKLPPVLHWIQNPQRLRDTLTLSATTELVKRVDIIDVLPVKKRVKKLMPGQKIMVDLNQWQKITATLTVGVFTSTVPAGAQPLRITAADGLLSWRPWQAGDRLTLKGGGHQLVRRILIDQKVPAPQRQRVMVLVNAQGDVLWVVGHKFAYRDRDTGDHTVFLALKHRS